MNFNTTSQGSFRTSVNDFANTKLVGLLLDEFSKLRKATVSFILSVCPFAWNNSAPIGGIYRKFDI